MKNDWNAFLKANKGSGKSMKQLSREYQAEKTAHRETAAVAPTTTRSGTAAWNQHQRDMAGRGLSRADVAKTYQDAKRTKNSVALPSAPRTTVTPPKASPPVLSPQPLDAFTGAPATSTLLTWNAFQHQLAGQGFPKHQVAALYKAYKASGGRADPGVRGRDSSMASVTADLDRLLREPFTGLDDWSDLARAAQDAEAHRGNTNRKTFARANTSTRSEDHKTLVEASALRHCEVIDAKRLNLSLTSESRVIGSGGSGVVYAALLDNKTPVAVKVLDPGLAGSRRHLEQELLAMMRASAHENVVQVLGYSIVAEDDDGQPSYGILMEFMGGGDLAHVLHRDDSVHLSETEGLAALVQVIKAIEYLHSQGITHRDVKPQNVLFSSDLHTAKLADFGLSLGAGVMGLTAVYAAPEVLENRLSFRDLGWEKSDVFSFTVMLAEVVMRRPPWHHETTAFIRHAVCAHERPFHAEDLRVASRSATLKLRQLVGSGWAHDPNERPTAMAMREQLERVVADLEGAAASTQRHKGGRPVVSSPRSVDAFFAEEDKAPLPYRPVETGVVRYYSSEGRYGFLASDSDSFSEPRDDVQLLYFRLGDCNAQLPIPHVGERIVFSRDLHRRLKATDLVRLECEAPEPRHQSHEDPPRVSSSTKAPPPPKHQGNRNQWASGPPSLAAQAPKSHLASRHNQWASGPPQPSSTPTYRPEQYERVINMLRGPDSALYIPTAIAMLEKGGPSSFDVASLRNVDAETQVMLLSLALNDEMDAATYQLLLADV